MNIDWDKLADDANDSPRGMLAELLSEADDITNLVVIWHDKESKQHRWTSTESRAMSIAMLVYATHGLMLEIDEA